MSEGTDLNVTNISVLQLLILMNLAAGAMCT